MLGVEEKEINEIIDVIQKINNTQLLVDGEEWKEHPFYKGYYGSNNGRVKYYTKQDKNEKIKIQSFDKRHKRFAIHIWFDGKQHTINAARFILECFCGINRELFVDHINSVPYDNSVSNLRYVDRKANNNNPNSRKKYKPSKTTSCFSIVEQIDIETNKVIKIWERFKTIEKELNLPYNAHKNIITVCNGRQKVHMGINGDTQKIMISKVKFGKNTPI